MEKIMKYQKKILNHESNFNEFKEINKSELEKFQTKLNYYKITTNLLYLDPNFYSELKFIELDHSIESDKYIYKEIIWIHEHYEYIEQIRSIELDIKLLLFKSHNIGLISNIQFRLAKKIYKSIDTIYKSDVILREFYSKFTKFDNSDDENYNKTINKNINMNQLKKVHLEFYFNLLEIIILKMYNLKKIYKKSNKIDLLLENQDYLNNILTFKNLLEKSL